MSSAKANGSNGRQIPETISRSSSLTVVSPIVRDGVGEIATKLGEIGGVIGRLDASPDTANVPDAGGLLQEIFQLQEEVKVIKLAQDTKIEELRDSVKNDLKKEIAEVLEDEIGAMITESVVAHLELEMEEWGNKPGVAKLASALENMVEANNTLLERGGIQLENSWSRHANSTIDIQEDLNISLKQVRRRDGRVSKLFPINLGELFSYDATKVVQLLEEHNLHPLEKHSENLSRFLGFIGVNASIPEQLIDFLEEQPPAYPARDTVEPQDEKKQKSARRRSSASEKSANASWYGIFGS